MLTFSVSFKTLTNTSKVKKETNIQICSEPFSQIPTLVTKQRRYQGHESFCWIQKHKYRDPENGCSGQDCQPRETFVAPKNGEKQDQREILKSRDVRQVPSKRRVEVQLSKSRLAERRRVFMSGTVTSGSVIQNGAVAADEQGTVPVTQLTQNSLYQLRQGCAQQLETGNANRTAACAVPTTNRLPWNFDLTCRNRQDILEHYVYQKTKQTTRRSCDICRIPLCARHFGSKVSCIERNPQLA